MHRVPGPLLEESQKQLLDNFRRDPFGEHLSINRCAFLRRTGKPCRRWRCGPCSVALAQQEASAVRRGLQRAHLEGQRTRFLTLTDGNPVPMHGEEFNPRCSRFLAALRRGKLADHYVSVLGVGQHGRLDRHVALIGPYVHLSVLREHAARQGLGRPHVKAIPDTPEARRNYAAYMGENALFYALVHQRSAARIQPFSRSQTNRQEPRNGR